MGVLVITVLLLKVYMRAPDCFRKLPGVYLTSGGRHLYVAVKQ